MLQICRVPKPGEGGGGIGRGKGKMMGKGLGKRRKDRVLRSLLVHAGLKISEDNFMETDIFDAVQQGVWHGAV